MQICASKYYLELIFCIIVLQNHLECMQEFSCMYFLIQVYVWMSHFSKLNQNTAA